MKTYIGGYKKVQDRTGKFVCPKCGSDLEIDNWPLANSDIRGLPNSNGKRYYCHRRYECLGHLYAILEDGRMFNWKADNLSDISLSDISTRQWVEVKRP